MSTMHWGLLVIGLFGLVTSSVFLGMVPDRSLAFPARGDAGGCAAGRAAGVSAGDQPV